MNKYKVVNENVTTIKGVTLNKSYSILNSDNGLVLFVDDDGSSVALPNTWFEGLTDEKPKGGRERNPDADPFNELEVEYNPNNDEMSPCFQCNI